MTPPLSRPSAIDRLPNVLRLVLMILAATAAITALAFCIGFARGYLGESDGAMGPRGIAILGGGLFVAALLGFFAWQLSAHWRRPGRSSYERRYSRTMVILFACGFPLGLAVGMAGGSDPAGDLFSNSPLDPTLAAVAALGSVIILAFSLVLYHRSIDDHEERAYLWANSLAFYFVALTIPAVWLLARGGLIPAIGIGTVMLILLASFAINLIAWAWLKYR